MENVEKVILCDVNLLVVFGGRFELAEEDVSISKVAVRPPLGRLVAKLASNVQSLRTQHNR